MKTRRKPKGTLPGTVHLSNKACPHYYHPRDPDADPRCGCPGDRCWYDEQLARRAKTLLALTPEEWHRRITGKSPGKADPRLEGERKRFLSSIERLRALVDSLEDLVRSKHPTASVRQAVTMTATQASNHAAVIDALIHQRSET